MKTHCFCWELRVKYFACCRCGLVRLRNARSQAEARKPCPGHEED